MTNSYVQLVREYFTYLIILLIMFTPKFVMPYLRLKLNIFQSLLQFSVIITVCEQKRSYVG